jgi:acyl-CoA thioesterase II
MDLPEAGGATTRIWLHASGLVPAEPVINGCVVTYLTVLTLLEPALGLMGKSSTDVSALLDHTVWFRRPADFSDWLFFEQNSPSGIGRRALATGTLLNRSGALMGTASQEGYFPALRNS